MAVRNQIDCRPCETVTRVRFLTAFFDAIGARMTELLSRKEIDMVVQTLVWVLKDTATSKGVENDCLKIIRMQTAHSGAYKKKGPP
jgi:hypothetical protein